MKAFISATPIPLSNRTASFFVTPLTTRFKKVHHVSQNVKMLADPISTSHLLTANPAALQSVADAFNTLGLPKPVVEWGHPALMTFMVLGMGAPGAVYGWAGRLNKNKKEGVAQKKLHENIMVAFFLLAVLGGTGGTLSVAMQGYDVWQSPHFLSATLVLVMLGANSLLAYSGFTLGSDGSSKGRIKGRKIHAYFGIAAMSAFLLHGILGVNILLG